MSESGENNDNSCTNTVIEEETEASNEAESGNGEEWVDIGDVDDEPPPRWGVY